MRFSEFLIIYLALGLPLGIDYLLSNRRWTFSALIKSFLISILWPFYSLQMASCKHKKIFSLQDEREALRIKKQLEDLIRKEDLNIFEVRRMISRYIELTLAEKQCMDWKVGAEVLKLSNHPNLEVGIRCLQRKNCKRIKTHRDEASKAFINAISPLFYNEDVYQLSLRLAESLKDEKTAQNIRENHSFTQKIWEEAKAEEEQIAIR